MVLCALFAALLAVCAWLVIPAGDVPFTLQTFGVFAALGLLGGKRGTIAIAVYLLLGAVGAPVFAGFKGGFGALLGVTGGYIVGFLFTALVVGLAAERRGRKLKVLIPAMIVGILLCYAFGTAWFVLVYTKNSGAIGVGTALAWCVLPYIPADAAKLLLASFLAVRLYPLVGRRPTT
jgi:biotin transport system substrate-specific component